MSSDDVTDFAALISQYEATEHDMLNNLDAASAADSSAAKSNDVPLPLLTTSNPRRNAPSFSDSDDSDDDESDTGNDDTSYTAEDANEAEENTETSYTEGNEDGESENDSSESEEWESDGDDDDEEDQSSQPTYTEEGTSEHSDEDYGSHGQSPSAASKSSARSLDPDGINATSTFEEFAPKVQRRKNAPVSDSDDSDSDNQSHTSYTEDDQNGVPSSPHFISPVSIGKEIKNLTPKVPKRRNAPDSDSDSDSDNASYEYVEEEIQEGGNNTNEKPDSTRSYESYETADSEGRNEDGSASFYESGEEDDDGDEGSASFYDSADDSGSNDDDDSDSDSDSDSSYSKDSEDDNNRPSFNQRGDSNHGFQHPSIADNPVSDDDSDSDSSSGSDSDNSGWDDTGDMSHSESANDEEFENEPFKASILGGDDNIEIESDSSESGFEDEPRKTKKKKAKGDSSDSDSDSSSGSDSSSDSSDSSENDFEDEDHSIDVYDGEEALSLASSKRKKKRGSTNLSSTERSAELEHIISREKIVEDRENTVNTRERKFTRWFIIAAGIVLLGAIILLSVYFTRPGRTAAPTPSTVTITIPTDMPVTIPIGIPATPTTSAPTPLPANKVIVETSFLAFIRDGKTIGLTTENLESELQTTMGMFLPGLLTDVADSVVTSARRFLRRLQSDKLKIDDSIGVDVSEIDCPTGSPASDLCVEVTTNVPIINSSNDFTDDFASGLQTALSDALIQQFDNGILQTLGSTVVIGLYEEGEALPTEAPTVSPKNTTAPTKTPTEAPTVADSEVTGSAVPTGVAPTDNIFVTLSPTPIADSNSTQGPTTGPIPTESPTEFGTVDPDASQAPSPANSPNNVTVTSSPTVAPTVCEDRNEACMDSSESAGNCTLTKCAFWATEGECTSNPNYMNVNCVQSCGLCGDVEGPPEPECTDENEQCPEWAVQGECTRNEAYMSVNCKDSCGYCGCEDQNADCADVLSSNNTCIQSKCELWATQGECENNVDYMTIYCRKSCERCVDLSCIDEDSRCGGWASSGECDNNPDYMSRNCKKSCALC